MSFVGTALEANGSAAAQSLAAAGTWYVLNQWTGTGLQQQISGIGFLPTYQVLAQLSSNNILVQNSASQQMVCRATFSGSVIGFQSSSTAGLLFAFFKTGGGSTLSNPVAITTNGTEGRAIAMSHVFLLNSGDALEVRVQPTVSSDDITKFYGSMVVEYLG